MPWILSETRLHLVLEIALLNWPVVSLFWMRQKLLSKELLSGKPAARRCSSACAA